ncbi:UrcA family protein [Parvularcula sp. ZS-1/3]|uniref:UrcA family protein n=1 Tax=Parvularcula mediterranea TaxID=2732508 RepID=A0A7Y3RIT1_9PROT|nr:UrcA family protein [Parvularcula mediterranea]NNU14822.1 UrcA family protein [Parvularcula mediterranea]
MTNFKTIAAAIAVATAGLTAGAHAGDFSFSYEKEELLTADGRTALYERLRVAAHHYCRSTAPTQTFAPRKRACEVEIMTSAAESFDSPAFAALVREEQNA